MGQNYFKRMLAKETKEMERKRYEEEQEAKRLAAEKAEKTRLLNIEREKIRKQKEKEMKRKQEERRITRWFENGWRYRGQWFEEENWENRTKPHRHNLHRTPHGQGELYNEKDNVIYKGEFFNGLKQGKGTHYVYDEDRPYQKFEGTFYKDLKHGLVTVTHTKTGEVRDGIFFNGKLAAWYDTLIDGRQIQIKLTRYSGYPEWRNATIERYDPTKKRKKHRIRIDEMFSKPKWYDLTKLEFKCLSEAPLKYTLIKPESEHLENNIPSIVRTDPIGNRKQFKQYLRKGFDDICSPIISDGNGNRRFRWKRGEKLHRIDGKAFAHPSHPRHEDMTPDDVKTILSSPYSFKNPQVERIEELMAKIDKKAMDKLGISPVRRALRLPNLPRLTNSLRLNKLVF
eukprot:g8092.t1